MEAKKDNAAAKLEKKQAKAKAKAEVKPKAKGKAKGKPKGKASKKNPCDKAELKRKSDAAAPKRKLKKTKVAVVSPHSTPVKPKPTGGRSWKPSPMALKESGGGKDRRFQKAVDALGELMDAMGTYKGKDFHGPGPKFAKKFLALINYTGP